VLVSVRMTFSSVMMIMFFCADASHFFFKFDINFGAAAGNSFSKWTTTLMMLRLSFPVRQNDFDAVAGTKRILALLGKF
jgi:hypothetical protein